MDLSRASSRRWLALLLALGLLLAACGGTGPQASGDADPPVLDSLPLAAMPEATATVPPMPPPTPAPGQLLVLHTNDNWGETEPCG